MSRSQKTRLDRIAEELGSECNGGCAKCAIEKIHAKALGYEWTGCNRQPMTLTEMLLSMQRLAIGRADASAAATT